MPPGPPWKLKPLTLRFESSARKSAAHSADANVSLTLGMPPQLALLPSPIQNSMPAPIVTWSMIGPSRSSWPYVEWSDNSAAMLVL